jgi:hypothetical protein
VVPPRSGRISRVPPYSRTNACITRTGLSPAKARLSRRFRLSRTRHWPGPRSLATTSGVSVDVLSSGYLDVSVPRVRFLNLWIQFRIPLRVGFPIRKFTDQSLFAAPRDLSQRTTSFIASQRQGIHRTPLRHLITLIVDARPPLFEGEQDRQKKDQFLRDLPDRSGLSLRVRATDPSRDLGQTFSSRCQKTRGSDPSGRTRIRIFRGMGLKPSDPSCPGLDPGVTA